MRFPVPLCLFVAVAVFHTALSASLESAEKEETIVKEADGLTELQKRDQMEFEAAQMNEKKSEDSCYLEAVREETVEEQVEAEDDNRAEGDRNSDSAAHEESESESTEDTGGMRHKRQHNGAQRENMSNLEEVSVDVAKEQDVVE